MPEAIFHPAALPLEELLSQCDVLFLRRSGPGGQHRNKVSTAVVLRHRPSGIQAEANERRSQSENRTQATFRLRIQLALEIRTERALSEIPSPLWKSRCRGERIEICPTHDDFPALLAEALDVLAACASEPKLAAEQLGCTASQLVKLLKKESQAFQLTNRRRQQLGLRPLQ